MEMAEEVGAVRKHALIPIRKMLHKVRDCPEEPGGSGHFPSMEW